MEVRMAEHMGMCFGVRDAVDLAMHLTRQGPITILGDLVHNPDVVAQMDAAGAKRARRAEEVQTKLGDTERFPVEFIDAGKQEDIEALARKHHVDLIMNAVDPVFNQQIFDAAPANEVWTLQSPDEIPNVLIHFDHQVRHLELQVVDAATGKPVHPVFSNYLERDFVARSGLRPPAGGPYNTDANNDDVTAFPWDGTRMHDNGNGTPDHRKVVPDGSYKIVVKALKAGGDARNPNHWETWTTPTIKIDRP